VRGTSKIGINGKGRKNEYLGRKLSHAKKNQGPGSRRGGEKVERGTEDYGRPATIPHDQGTTQGKNQGEN